MPERILLLDTDIVSLSGSQHPPPGLRQWLLEAGIERLGIGFPVITELMRGACLLGARNPERAAAIRRWILQIIAEDFVVPSMGPEVAEVYAQMTSIPSLRHMWTSDRSSRNSRLGHDLMIASLSIVHRAPIVTANPRDYVRIHEWFELPGVYHPLEARWYVEPDHHVFLPPFEPEDTMPPGRSLPRIFREEPSVGSTF